MLILPISCASRHISHVQTALAVNTRNVLTKVYIAKDLSTNCLTYPYLANQELDCLAKLVHSAEQLEAQKPTSYDNEFKAVTVGADGGIVLENERFKTRIRKSKQV